MSNLKKPETPRPIRGTQSLYGEAAARFEHIIDTFHRVRKLYGFKRVEVPVFEATAVFARSLGETTDVVSKEMYSFEDRGGESLTLRPEFTAGICRAYLTEGWRQHGVMKLATHGPLFRYERPQKGRFRQFHQIDAEILGAAEPAADVELLALADHLLKELGLANGISLRLNTLGDAESRTAWRAALVQHFQAHIGDMSPESQMRLERNPMRILDSKDPRDIKIAQAAPDIDAYLSAEAAAFFKNVTQGLERAGIKWVRDARLVRGLDYYRHTAFEFVPDAGSQWEQQLGAQSTLIGGGRYDGLMENLGGALTPAVGWAAGIERLALLVPEPVAPIIVTIIADKPEWQAAETALTHKLRAQGIIVNSYYEASVKRRVELARKHGLAAIIYVRGERDYHITPISMQDTSTLLAAMDS
jgi:histidyl-tRNA synthetase